MPSPLDRIKQKASSVSIAQLLKQIPDVKGTDYDIEGYYADHGIPYKSLEDMALSHAITGAHYSDEDKLPWHPSFSMHSKYSDQDMEGGKWQQGGREGSELWNFTPSEINMEYSSPEAYKKMWLESQPKGTFITLPNGDVVEGNERNYADGGTIEYNPITIDQIIDATHQELGTGRYAKGGSVNKMQAIPQNESLAALAYALSKGRDIGNKVQLPYDLGGVGDLLVGKTPEEIENWSYGNAPMQVPEMSNFPQFKKGRGESFGDAVTTLLPLAKWTKDVPAGLSFIGPNSKGWDKVAAELAAKNLNEALLGKHLAGETLTPDEMMKYEYNGRLMETPQLQRYNVENADAQGADFASRAKERGYDPDDIYTTNSVDEWLPLIKKKEDVGNYGGIFDGVFLLNNTEGGARGYDYSHQFIANPEKVAGHYDKDLDFNKTMSFLKKEYGHELNDDELSRLYDLTAYDDDIWDGGENVLSKLDDEYNDLGRASWEAQNIRGKLAKDQDFDLIKMRDEEGTSYFAPYGSKIKSTLAAFDPLRKNSPSLLASVLGGTALSDLALKYEDKAQDSGDQYYADGGSVEYNPIKIDQIIDATHKELGTGRYADGGSVNTTLKLG